jgi:hypothetical protein
LPFRPARSNEATGGNGGAIVGDTMTVVNSTLQGNSAASQQGGGVYAYSGDFGVEYCFSARAVDAGGHPSPFGPERCVTVGH